MSDLSDAITALGEATALVGETNETLQRFLNEVVTWQSGTATGGPNGDGTYPFTAPDGVVVYEPSPQKLAALTEPGEAGIGEAPADGYAYLRRNRAWGKFSAYEVSLQDFYANDSATDQDAFNAFAAAFNSGSLGSVVRLVVPPSKGRGNVSTGNYFLSDEVLFTGPYRLEIDGLGSCIRLTAAASKFRYRPPPTQGANAAVYPFFVVKNFLGQAAERIDCFAYWDIPFAPSRINGTGYAENIVLSPQLVDNSSHDPQAMFRIKNTWAFTAFRCHHSGKPRTPTDLLSFPNQVFIRQEGVCVVTDILSCEINYVYQPIQIGTANMVGINGSYAPAASAPLQRGCKIVQGASTGYVGRTDNGYSYTYSLYDAVGSFSAGTAQVYDWTGATLIGTLTISSTGTYVQASEAIAFDGGTATATCSYGLYWRKPVGLADNFLNTIIGNCHFAPSYAAIDVDGVSAFTISDKANFLTVLTAGSLISINNGYLVSINAFNASNNGKAGAVCITLRNTSAFRISGPQLTFFDSPLDIDNTVKDGSVESFACDQNVGLIRSTANRFNGTSLRGVRFRNNGHVGIGFDLDDVALKAWTPTATAGSGSIGSYIASGAYVIENGKFTFTISVQITNRNSASGQLKLTLPNEIANSSGITLNDTTVAARNSNGPAFPMMALVGINALGTGLRGITVEHQNPNYGAFHNFNGTLGNYNYVISGSVPLRLN